MLRVGVDTGGTSTDAVVLDSRNTVRGWSKAATSPDVLTGVLAAVQGALQDAGAGDPAHVSAVMLGTTQFVNACITLRGLAPVALVRLCGPATRSLPPFSDLPPGLRGAVGGAFFLAAGGCEIDGRVAPLDEPQLHRIARQILSAGLRCVVVSCVFGPLRPDQERMAAAILQHEAAAAASAGAAGGGRDDAGDPPLVCCQSHAVTGQLGLLERENAAVLNAALLPLARRVVPACQAALAEAGIRARLFLTCNDGTLMPAANAQQMPVLTFQSGPVNSQRGAALLTGLQHAVVIDIGGTTTDVGFIGEGGLPRPAPRTVRFAGAHTNFQMPDVISVGLGGGSLLHIPPPEQPHIPPAAAAAAAAGDASPRSENAQPLAAASTEGPACISVGPDSVGARLAQEALCMGGIAGTATDAAVLLGRMQLGSRAAVEAALTRGQAEGAWKVMQRMLEDCLDAIKTSAGEIPVIVVGGGAQLCGDRLAGASRLVRPHHAAVANAVGAAIAQVSGTVDLLVDLGGGGANRAALLAEAELLARQRAVQAGAVADSCWVAEREEVPLAYLPGQTCRLRVKVIGDLNLASLAPAAQPVAAQPVAMAGDQPTTVDAAPAAAVLGGNSAACFEAGWPPLEGRDEEPLPAALAAWLPVLAGGGEWVLHPEDLHLIATGCGILGSGGGGSPGKALLKALLQIKRAPGSMRVISPSSVPEGGLVADAGYMGAPTASQDKLDSGQAEAAVQAALDAYRPDAASAGGAAAGTASCCGGGEVSLAAVLGGEVGGGNGIEPLVVGSRLGQPVVDGDYMGRAFPELQMMTPAICGLPLLPAALADEKGNAVVVQRAASAAWLERLLRPLCAEMGCSAGFSMRPLTGEFALRHQLRQVVVPGSLSYAWRLGQAVAAAQACKQDAPAAVAAQGGGKVLFRGKVVDVKRQTTGGFARGELLLEGCCCCAGGGAASNSTQQTLTIHFQNENVMAWLDGHLLLASVPDLICCLESENGLPIATEEQRYGLRVSVIALPANPQLTTAKSLAVVGPAAFGYRQEDVQYEPVALYREVEGIPR